MKRVVQLSAVGVIAVIALWIWPGFLSRGTDTDQDPASYRTATITRRNIGSTVLATGVIRPRVGAEVQVGSRVSGVLQTLNVSIGDQVEADEVLARLDPTEFQARLDQTLAALETAEVTLPLTALAGERVLTVSANNTYPEFGEALRLVADGAVRCQPLLTHHFPLAQAIEAFSVAERRTETGAIKVVLHP